MGRPLKERYRICAKHVLIVLALGALVAVSAVGIATAAGGENAPSRLKVGNLELNRERRLQPEGAVEDEADADRTQGVG